MKHQIKFYPVGNGDTSQIILDNGKRLLFDFRHVNKAEGEPSPEIDLKECLRSELKKAGKDYFDVVVFTHGDQDHIAHSTEFFELLHAEKYQGEGRIKINELWVSAAMILETADNDHQSDEFVIWRQEARHRLKAGAGIRIFSKPNKLKKWIEENTDFSLEDCLHLITDAGQVADGLSLLNDGVEFFCHSPFIKHVEDSEELRNEAALVFQVRFEIGGVQTNYIAIGDSTSDVLDDIVNITKLHGNDDRLDWDILNIPHHCSYLALSDEKGEVETIPTKNVEELLRHGELDSFLVSSSKSIDSDEDAYSQVQPPHIQAKNCYEKYLKEADGRKLIVTMEEPNSDEPKPLIFEITGGGISKKNISAIGAAAIISSSPPRAG